MISRPYFVPNKSILAILNFDFGRISLSKTVIALCRASFTSWYKVFITIAGQSGSDSISGSKFWLVLQKTPALEQSYTLQGYMLLVKAIVRWVPTSKDTTCTLELFIVFKPKNKNFQRANATVILVCCTWIHPTIGWRRDAGRVVSAGITNTRTARGFSVFCITFSLENDEFSVLHYVEKVALHYLMLNGFGIHSALELSRTALLGCLPRSLTSLRGCSLAIMTSSLKISNFSRLHCLNIPRGDLGTNKTKPNIEKWPESLGVVLEF